MTNLPKALFLSHGGGPLPLLGDEGHREMVACLEDIAAEMPRPSAIVVVSAHWEASLPRITAAANPSLIYDYYGFPEASYDIQYPCPGEPALALELHALLDEAGIAAELDETRGFDHGLFVPLKIMFPAADIPCVQLSLVDDLDPARHIAIGRALAGLHRQGVLLVGSGFSFHNLQAFFRPDSDESLAANHDFEAWLLETCASAGLTEAERAQRLIRWSDAPGARFCHPREEHLLPLHVCYGAAQSACSKSHQITIMGKAASIYSW